MKRLLLLGASGSIGVQTLDIVRRFPEEYSLVSFGVGHRVEKVAEILSMFPEVSSFSVAEETDAEELRKQYPDKEILSGDEGMITLAERDDYDLLVNALVGFVGFLPTYRAIAAGHDVALANKETLVCGGALIEAALKKYGRHLYPIDSEHSAIWQCLQGNRKDQVERLIITCSGGPFRTFTKQQLASVTVTQALAHPRWTMGAKITIDSADLMNKGFEVIEAHWLFGLPYEKIDVVVHPESTIHSMVEYVDHSVMAQMAVPDMRLPIAYALSWPDRHPLPVDALDLLKVGSLHFEAPDTDRFPLLALAYEAGKAGGNQAAIVNGANEAANAAFRSGLIGFTDITRIVEKVVHSSSYEELNDIDALLRADRYGRSAAEAMIQGERKS